MDIRFHAMDKKGLRLDCAIVPVFEGESVSLAEEFANTPLSWCAGSTAFTDHSGKANEITVCYGDPEAFLPRIILMGLGPKEEFSLNRCRSAVAAAMRTCKKLRLPRIGMAVVRMLAAADELGKNRVETLRESALAACLALYSCTEHRSVAAKSAAMKRNDPEYFTPDALVFLHHGNNLSATVRAAVKTAEAEAVGVCFARDLVNAPANVMTPSRLAEEALALAKRHGFACRVMHKAELAKLGMGALLAVSEGSDKDALVIVLEHWPAALRKRAPLVLVGKGITFDSGGVSLKPAAGMHRMKGDMAGGAAVLGAFEAFGKSGEKSSCPVVGLIPCAENMPDGAAVKPGDVVTAFSGKTVEILNTDAEGRLILCDALAYAQKSWSPLAVVDIATLTGACMVALGRNAAGLFTKNAALRGAVMNLSESVGETIWPMPLWDHLRDGLKSDVADIANVGSREGGAISAALFLQAFVEDNVPWAHLDMAGAGIREKETFLCAKGATGFGVRTLFGLIRNVSDKMFS